MTPVISRWVAALSLASAFAAASSTIAPQQASAARCEQRDGSLQMWDAAGVTPADPWGANSCGYFYGDNGSWGPYGWTHRADNFHNQGRTHNVYIYHLANRAGGAIIFLRRKAQSTGWSDFGDSNYWTTD